MVDKRELEALISERMGADLPPPLPHELTAPFDCATWAAVHALVTVLRRKGVLDTIAFGELCEEMLKIERRHAESGETQRAEAVADAAKEIALIVAPAD